MLTLEGKVAIVSGSGRGIGREIALKLAAHGASVVVNDLDAAPAEETVEAVRAAGGEAVAFVANATQPGFGDRFVETALRTFGGLDIVVNNAGYTWDNVIQKMSDEQWQALLDIHMTAPFRVLRAAADHFRAAAKKDAEEGREVFRKVVNVSSNSGVYGTAGQVGYSAAKAGVIGLTKALAKEWGRYKVNVNAVAYGLIGTRLTDPAAAPGGSIEIDGNQIKVGVNPDLMKTIAATTPLGRAGTPTEAAGAVYMLCLPESDYLTAQVVMCNGGRP